jgi:hypothetical protein
LNQADEIDGARQHYGHHGRPGMIENDGRTRQKTRAELNGIRDSQIAEAESEQAGEAESEVSE